MGCWVFNQKKKVGEVAVFVLALTLFSPLCAPHSFPVAYAVTCKWSLTVKVKLAGFDEGYRPVTALCTCSCPLPTKSH